MRWWYNPFMRSEARIPSNRMRAYKARRTSIVGWLFLSAWSAGFLYVCISYPMFILAIVVIAIVSWLLTVFEKRRQQQILAERTQESICSFARSFDCRATDPWIVRAVFEELVPYVRFPIRAEDRLEGDLLLDSDDVDELDEAIAQRTGRPLEQCEQNPLYEKVTTVREVVEFFVHQPPRSRCCLHEQACLMTV